MGLVLVASASLVALLAVVCHARFGSVTVALRYLRGDRLIATPTYFDLGTIEPKTDKSLIFYIYNWTGEQIEILGSNSSCGCMTTAKLPLTLLPNQSETISIAYRSSAEGQPFEQHIDFYTDYDRKRYIRVTIRGAVSGSGRSPKVIPISGR
jgi:Protein of unknown function (DUF1573)